MSGISHARTRHGRFVIPKYAGKAAGGRFYVFIINLVQSHNLNTVYAYTQNC